jgi:PAS domain S-box-containing protein
MRQISQEQLQHPVPADGTPMQQWVDPTVLTVAVGVAYFLAARLSLLLMTQPGVAVFWPAAGVASGILIALGRTARWPVAIGVIAANIPANLTGDRNVLSSTIFSLSDAGEALLIAWMIERYIGPDFSLGRLRHVLGLLAAVILGTAVSGVGGTLGYKLAYNPNDPAMTVWQQWVASDTIGIIAVAPLVIGIVATFRAPPRRRELLEGVMALIAVAATTGLIIFMLPPDWWEMCAAVVLLFPVVLWVAARCPPVFASAAVFIVALIVITTVTFKLGHFSIAAPSIDDSTMSAQVTILGTGLCAFVLSALFAERRQHEAVLAESEARLQEALAVGAVIAFEWDTSTDLVRRSNNAAQILGYDPQQVVTKASFVARIHPDDLGRIKELWNNLHPNNTASTSYRFLRFDGREIWLQEMSKGEFDATGRLVRVKGLALDITERKQAEKRQKVLMAELDHRVKNILARVAAVAKYTFEGDRPTSELIRALDGRIQSMADAHMLLSQSHGHGVGLADLVQRQLAPYTTKTNIVISGPDITLTEVSTEALAMVLQELVTNAAKYGSLSTPHGRVSVNWDRRHSADGLASVVIAWRETGGPSTKAPSPSGYGTSLIRNLIPHEIGGIVNLVFAPDGLHCDIEIPLKGGTQAI